MNIFEIIEIGDTAIIQAKTNLIYETVSKGRTDIFGLLRSMNFSMNIEIDLSEVEYIDSSGIGLLLTVKKHLEENGKTCTIFNLTNSLKKIKSLNFAFSLFKEKENVNTL